MRAVQRHTTPESQQITTHQAPVQRHESLRGVDYDTAVQRLAPVQAKEDTGSVHAAAERGTSGGGGALPYMGQIQKSFGAHDVSGISAHVGGKATEACEAMGAEAYASGSSVAFKGGPDLHTAAHEAAHIVQQRSGVQLSGGVGKVGDSYEQHADAVADRVVQGKSAEDLLGGASWGGAAAVQRSLQMKDDKGWLERLKAFFLEAKLTGPQQEVAKLLKTKHGVDVSGLPTSTFASLYRDAGGDNAKQSPDKTAANMASAARDMVGESSGKPTQKKESGVVSGGSVQRKEARHIQRKLNENKIRKALSSPDAQKLLEEIKGAALQAKSTYDTIKDKKEQLETIIAAIDALRTPSKTAGDDVRRFQAFYKAISLAIPKIPVVSDFNDMMIEGLASVAVAFDKIFGHRDQSQKESGIGLSLYQQTGESNALMWWAKGIENYDRPAAVKPTSGMVKGWLTSKQSILAAATGVSVDNTGIHSCDNAKAQGFGAYRNWIFIHRKTVVPFIEKLTGPLS